MANVSKFTDKQIKAFILSGGRVTAKMCFNGCLKKGGISLLT